MDSLALSIAFAWIIVGMIAHGILFGCFIEIYRMTPENYNFYFVSSSILSLIGAPVTLIFSLVLVTILFFEGITIRFRLW